jgi:hypothetical protein
MYQYNGEMIYDQPNYTFYHYYLEKYQDHHSKNNILIMCKEMIEKFRSGNINKQNQNVLMGEIVSNIF